MFVVHYEVVGGSTKVELTESFYDGPYRSFFGSPSKAKNVLGPSIFLIFNYLY